MLLLLLTFLTAGTQSRPLGGKPVTQMPLPTCRHSDCLYESKCYADGEEISHGYDGSSWCYGMVCLNGAIASWDNFNCGPSTTTPPSTAAKLQKSSTPTTPYGCVSNGKWYAPGSEVSQGNKHGLICGNNGQLITATTLPTELLGCFHNGDWYPLGSEVSRRQDSNGWCYGTYCGDNGQLVSWDDWNCGTTIEPTTTIQPIPPTTQSPSPEPAHHGCFHNGKWYSPGSDITKGSDDKGWCYGTFCTADGGVVAWDNWNCDQAITEAPSPTTTPTTVPIPLGCFQNGAWYEPGSEISRESEGEGWCHGISCDPSGKIVAWDDWNCAATENSHPKKLQPGTQPKGCYYENQWHPYGSIFEGSDSSGCKYGAMCSMDGQVLRWDEINCKPIN